MHCVIYFSLQTCRVETIMVYILYIRRVEYEKLDIFPKDPASE